MALAVTNKTAGGVATDATSYTTSGGGTPFALTADVLYLVVITNDQSAASTAATPTLTDSGSGNTWVQVATVEETTNHARVTMFRGRAVATESVQFTTDFAGATQLNYNYDIITVTGEDPSGTNGSGAIGSTGSAIGNSAVPLATVSALLTDARNVVVGGLYTATDATGVAPSTDWTQITEVDNEANTLATLQRQGNRSASWAITSGRWGAIAVEIRADPASYDIGIRNVYDNSDATNGTSYPTSGSWTVPVASGRSYVVAISGICTSGTPGTPAVSSSGGETVTAITNANGLRGTVGPRVTLYWFVANGTGNRDVSFTVTGNSWHHAAISVEAVTGDAGIVPINGANGNSVGTNLSFNLSAFADARNLQYSAGMFNTAPANITPGGFELSESVHVETTNTMNVQASVNDTTANWTNSGTSNAGAACEIQIGSFPRAVFAPVTAVQRASSW